MRRGKGGKDRVVPLGEEAAHWVARYLREARPAARARRRTTRSSSRRAAGASTRARCAGSSPTRTGSGTRSRRTCSRAAPTCARSRSCSATARSRRRRSTATSTPGGCARSTTARTRAPTQVSGLTIPTMLARRLLPRALRRAARAADGRGLPARPRRPRGLARRLAGATRRRTSSPRYVAQLRADGLAATTIARRVAALRSFFRHQVLLGARAGQPGGRARAAAPPPGAAEDALAGRGRAADRGRRRDDAARAARPRARRAALRRGPARQRGGRPRARRRRPRATGSSAAIGKGSKERVVPIGREAVEALRRYLSRGRPYLDKRHRPELFLNAQGGALTRAGAFLILRRLAAEGRPRARTRPPASAPPLLRDPPARGRRRPALRSGDARARRSGDDRALHPRIRSAPPRVVLPERTPTRARRFEHVARERVVRWLSIHTRDARSRRRSAVGWLMTRRRPPEERARAEAAPARRARRAAGRSQSRVCTTLLSKRFSLVCCLFSCCATPAAARRSSRVGLVVACEPLEQDDRARAAASRS